MVKYNDCKVVSLERLKSLERMLGTEADYLGISEEEPNFGIFMISDGEVEITLLIDVKELEGDEYLW